MDPATLAVVSLGATVLSTGVSLVGGIQQASAASDAAKYQAQVARNNQIISEQNAQYAISAAEAKAQAEDLKQRALLGSIEAAQGASGIAFDSPSLEQIRESQAQVGRLSTRTVYNEGQLVALGQKQRASQYGSDAELTSARSSSARTAGYIGAGTSLLSGASSFSDKWMKFRYVGVEGF